jgi:hypothetical protein
MAAIKIDSNMSAVAYHVIDGQQTFPYAIDAHSAVSRFPGEWSFEPWSTEDAAKARETLTERHARETEEAKAAGLKPPAPLPPEPVPPTPEEQAAIDEHAKAVAAANERLAAFRKKRAEEQAIADQVAADEALVASPPPRPDPTARKPLSPAQIRKRAAETDDERIVREKTEADKIAAASAKS